MAQITMKEAAPHIARLANQARDLARQIQRLKDASCDTDENRTAFDAALDAALDDGSEESRQISVLGRTPAKKK